MRDKNLLAATTVVRTAYLSIKLGDSFASITPRLANLSLAGAELGQKNHSYAIPPEVVDEAAKVIEEQVNLYFTSPLAPCFGLFTDKISTTGQRTRQMTSARLVNLSPDDPMAPLIINVYLGHPACDDKSSSG